MSAGICALIRAKTACKGLLWSNAYKCIGDVLAALYVSARPFRGVLSWLHQWPVFVLGSMVSRNCPGAVVVDIVPAAGSSVPTSSRGRSMSAGKYINVGY